MKQISTFLNLGLVCILVWLAATIAQPNASARAIESEQATPTPQAGAEEWVCNTGRTVQVSGTAVVNVIPDRALIQLGVQSNGLTPRMVEATNSATVNDILRALKKLGIEEKDVVTDWYVIEPVYDSYSSLYIKGYRINNVVAITLRDIGRVNQVIIDSLEAGANQVIHLEFYLSDLRKYRDQARDLAMKAAQEKAHDLAAAAGSEAGCVMSINENTWSYYNGGWYGWYGQSRDLWTQNTVQNAAPTGGEGSALSDGGPVDLGQISVRAEVSASFSLK